MATTTLHPQQHAALRRLAEASRRVTQKADKIIFEAAEQARAVQEGRNAPDFNHQTPFDLHEALVLRRTYIDECLNLDIRSETIIEYSKGIRRLELEESD